jgi:hypothetical protein
MTRTPPAPNPRTLPAPNPRTLPASNTPGRCLPPNPPCLDAR